jgi:D-aminopeptidase
VSGEDARAAAMDGLDHAVDGDGTARRPRARDLGIVIGRRAPGPANAITDVAGVRVGHVTLVRGDGPLVVGEGPVRTGVTAILPHGDDLFLEGLFAGWHRLNGNGELTGTSWIDEAGLLIGPIALTNTHSVGVVRDAIVARAARSHPHGPESWSLPVVGETFDGTLNDVNGFHVTAAHVDAAIDSATGGPVAEGSVGGGTGMICHEFKGGIGTASRALSRAEGGWTVGVLVQANHGVREDLRIDGVPVGAELPITDVPSPYPRGRGSGPGTPGAGSIVMIVATDAPLLPHQCRRVAQRAGLGMARTGGYARNSSGDFVLAFATGNRGLGVAGGVGHPATTVLDIRMVPDDGLDGIFAGVVEATEEAIVNALLAAGTMRGVNGIEAHGLAAERVTRIMGLYGRGPQAETAG